MGAVLPCPAAVWKHSLSCNPVGNLSTLKRSTKATGSPPHDDHAKLCWVSRWPLHVVLAACSDKRSHSTPQHSTEHDS